MDVARVAGVSPITVSRTLRQPDRVSKQARTRVAAAIAKTGYVPDLVASSLTSGRTQLIGVVIPTMTASIYASTLQGLTDGLRKQHFQVLIGDSGYDLDVEQQLVSAFLGRRADGLVLSNVVHAEATRRMLRRSRVPVIETGNLSDDPIDMMVGFSNYAAARAMMAHLIARGHRTIGYIGARVQDNAQAADRRRAYDDAVGEHGLTVSPGLALQCGADFSDAAGALVDIVQKHAQVTAIFAASEVRAVGALLECQRRGWPVPDRIAIAGFNDAGIGASLRPSLTTVHVPRHEIGSRAAAMILERVAGRRVRQRVIDVGFEIRVREST